MVSNKKNLVFIAPFGLRPKGTVSVRALPLAKALAGRGHTVTLLIPPWDDPERAGQTWVEAGVEVVNLPLPPRLPLLFQLLLTRDLVNRALARRPDVIHFFKPKAYAGLAHLVLWNLKRLKNLPVRLVVDADDWEQAWNERLPYSAGQKRFFAWQERWGLEHADAITVASRTLERMVLAETHERQTHIYYLPNGYRPDFAPGRYPRPNGTAANGVGDVRVRWQLGDGPTILLYSRFMEFRPERIVTLVQQVADRMPGARWLIVGDGLDGEADRLKTVLARAGLADYTRFTGWVPAGELPAYFGAATVAIHPYDDTLINRTKCSVKLIDLLAAALPVVADAIGQNCEYIQQNRSGVLVPPEDDLAFVEALVTLLDEPDTRQQLGQSAAYYIEQNFNWSHLSLAAERAYDVTPG